MLPPYAAIENANDHPPTIHPPVDPLNCPQTSSVHTGIRGKSPLDQKTENEPQSKLQSQIGCNKNLPAALIDVPPIRRRILQNDGVNQRKNRATQLVSRLAYLENQQVMLFEEAGSLLKAHNIANDKANVDLVHVDVEIKRLVEAIHTFMEKQYTINLV